MKTNNEAENISQTSDSLTSGVASCSPIDFDHPQYWVGKCPKCGWIGMSNDAAGGWPIADTGDYDDVVCPKCFGDPSSDNCERVPLDDAYPEDIQENA